MSHPPDENAFIRRMRIGRLRQMAIAGLSVVAAILVILSTSPDEIGGFSYHAIILLLALNAFFALRQAHIVLAPIEAILKRMRGIEASMDENKYDVARLYNNADDEFACLAAGMDHLIEKLVEKARLADERYLQQVAVVRATPFTFFTVSRSGKVFNIVKDHYGVAPLLKLVAGRTPTEKDWGRVNFASYQRAVRGAFDNKGMRWFDMRFPAANGQPEHNLRSTVQPLTDLSALVVMGDMPAIDKLVENMARPDARVSRTQKHAALRRFAASVAHDGRNVFTALNNLVMLQDKTQDAELREQLAAARDAIRRGASLMTELMQYAGETKYALRCMPAADACRKLYENPTLHALIPENITLVTDVSDKPMPDIDVDPDQAWKVSFNLVKNSVEAIGTSTGRIWLTSRPYEMTADDAKSFRSTGTVATGPGVMTSEVDDGPGIDPAIIDKIFDPYASSKGQGRGLGLSTVFSIIEAHNGAIRVRSQPGMGTAFEIFLPASRHAAEELAVVRKVAPNGEILLVDDDPAILHTTALVLRAIKIAAHPAANVEDAMRKVRTLRSRIKAILVDAHISEVARLLHMVREEYPDTLVVLSSGTPEASLHDLVAPSLYDSFLAKPYSIAELSAAIGGGGEMKGEKVKG